MNRVRAVALIAAALAVAGMTVVFALTSRPEVTGTSEPGTSTVIPTSPSAESPGPAATSPAAGPVPHSPAPAASTAEPGEDPSEPSTPAADQGVVDASLAFAAAWLNAGDPQWADKLAARSTPELAALWPTADPTTVPLGRVGDSRTVHVEVAGQVATVRVPVVDPGPVGVLGLELTGTDRGWLVSDVDWSPAR